MKIRWDALLGLCIPLTDGLQAHSTSFLLCLVYRILPQAYPDSPPNLTCASRLDMPYGTGTQSAIAAKALQERRSLIDMTGIGTTLPWKHTSLNTLSDCGRCISHIIPKVFLCTLVPLHHIFISSNPF